MKEVLIRALLIWAAINVIVMPIEWSRWLRYKKHHWSWDGYVNHHMWGFTQFLLAFDMILLGLTVAGTILYWILQPVLN